MPARTLTTRVSLLSLLGEIRYTLSLLQVTPAAASHAPAFQELRDAWTPVHAKEIALIEEQSDAQAKVDASDEDLDAFANRFSKAILTITHDDRNHPLYLHFFGKKTLSDFRRPILGGQLEAMRAWIPSLTASPHPELQALAPELTAKVAAGDEATKAKNQAKQHNRQFRDLGERQKLFDRANALRKEVYGALAKLPYEQPGLAPDFADQFFRSDTGDDAEDDTIASVTAQIEALTQELEAKKQHLAALEAEAAKAAAVIAQQQTDEAALVALEKQMAEAAAKADALKAKLGKK